jgi:hypothetical protein
LATTEALQARLTVDHWAAHAASPRRVASSVKRISSSWWLGIPSPDDHRFIALRYASYVRTLQRVGFSESDVSRASQFAMSWSRMSVRPASVKRSRGTSSRRTGRVLRRDPGLRARTRAVDSRSSAHRARPTTLIQPAPRRPRGCSARASRRQTSSTTPSRRLRRGARDDRVRVCRAPRR